MFSRVKTYLKELFKASRDIRFFLKKYPKDKYYYFSRLCGCCHILDKGCYTTPFQKGHGKAIYDDAQKFLNKIDKKEFYNDPSYNWCLEKITKWEQMQERADLKPMHLNPVVYENSSLYLNFIKSNISIRNFADKKIDESLLLDCIATAQEAPCACFMQTVRCYAIRTKTIIMQLSPHILGLTGFSNGIPALFCITADLRPYECLNRHLPYIDGSLFSQNLVLALRANNIYSVFLNFGQASEKDIQEVKRIVGIPDYEKIIVFLAAGYSNCVSEKPVRMNCEKIGRLI